MRPADDGVPGTPMLLVQRPQPGISRQLYCWGRQRLKAGVAGCGQPRCRTFFTPAILARASSTREEQPSHTMPSTCGKDAGGAPSEEVTRTGITGGLCSSTQRQHNLQSASLDRSTCRCV